MIFFDTSCVAKCYLHEAESEAVLDFVDAHPGIAISTLTTLELLVTVRRAVCAAGQAGQQLRSIMRRFEKHCRTHLWNVLPLTPVFFDETYAMLLRLATKKMLRTLDAMQLASARLAGAEILYTYDQRMLDLAGAFGLRAKRI